MALSTATGRGQGGLRRRRGLSRALSADPAPHRGAGDRRRLRRGLPPRRARLLAAAPPPEGAGGSPLPGHRCRHPRAIGKTVRRGDAGLGYLGVGTIEFLYEDGEFFFIEMNTRLQVEHPVTEAITDIDLVREQIRIAAGLPLSFTQDEVRSRATPSSAGSTPRTRAPSPVAGPDHRLPCARRPGRAARFGDLRRLHIPPYYDSLVGKLIVHGATAPSASPGYARLGEIVVGGIETTIPLFQDWLRAGHPRGRLPHPLARGVARRPLPADEKSFRFCGTRRQGSAFCPAGEFPRVRGSVEIRFVHDARLL